MQRTLSESKQNPVLITPVTFEERVFSENFIQFQLDIATGFSNAVTRSHLLEERKILAIMDYMRDLYADTRNGQIFGKSGKWRNYSSLLALIDETMNKLSQHYQWAGSHPLLPALSKIKNNIIRYVAVTQPQFFVSDDEKKSKIGIEGDASDFLKMNVLPHNRRVFSDNFLQQQATMIVTASNKVTDEGILEQENVKNLMEYMQDLFIYSCDGVIEGGRNKERSYDGLLKLVDDFSEELVNSYHWKTLHPLLPALKQIKKNIQDYIRIAEPQFAEKVQLGLGDNQASIASSRFAIAKDTCAILTCLAWTIPEKIITLDNGCETICGPKEACCPEVPLPKENLYCNLWAPKNSIKAFYQDAGEQCKAIDNLKAAPIRHTM